MIEMLEERCLKAARVLEEAEPGVLAYLDLPRPHWRRPHANSVQERTNREIERVTYNSLRTLAAT